MLVRFQIVLEANKLGWVLLENKADTDTGLTETGTASIAYKYCKIPLELYLHL